MPTTEERLAALEAKLAALTETTPTTYYEHQYSGEEIDNAVARALPNGAIDQAVGTFVRPNLLDNWYFEKPVNQRDGHISLQGVPVYNDAACTSLIGNQIEVAATCIKSGTNYERRINGHGGGFVKAEDVVRGYTGNGYTVDRWITDGKPVTIGSGIGVEAVSFLYQKFEQSTMDALNGKLITFSALTTSNGFLTGSWVVDNANQSDTRIAENSELILFRSPWTGNGWGLNAKTATHILAAKLELGSTQTLAHREGDKWVLNAVPEYGEQLRRCQMDLFKIGDAKRYCSLGNGVARDGQFVSITIPTPVTMRTMPVLIAPPVGFTMRHNDTILSGGANFSVDAFSQNSIMLKVQSQVALTPGDMWEAFLQPNGSLVFSAEL